MTQPLIISQLRAKQAEVEAQIESMTARIAEARHDLNHLAATLRLFDPQADDKPATVYQGANIGDEPLRLCWRYARLRWRPRRSHCARDSSPITSSRPKAGTSKIAG